ncbi:MAG: chitobiase/beta-hexosaminidase C-terminal domain-containing protein [Gemmatimonadaceae bacterium]
MDGIDWVEPGESWEEWPENYDPGGDAEFFFPSPGLSVAQRLLSRNRRRPTRPVVPPPSARATPAPIPAPFRAELTKIYDVMKRLEQKQDEQTKQLAFFQQRSSGLQTGDLFRQSLTSAVINAAPSIASKDYLLAAAQLLPAAQSWRGAAPSIATKPVSTIAFPAVAALAIYLAKKPMEPTIITSTDTLPSGGEVRVTMTSSTEGGEIYFTTDGSDPTKKSSKYSAPFPQKKKGTIKARAFVFLRGSDPAQVEIT